MLWGDNNDKIFRRIYSTLWHLPVYLPIHLATPFGIARMFFIQCRVVGIRVETRFTPLFEEERYLKAKQSPLPYIKYLFTDIKCFSYWRLILECRRLFFICAYFIKTECENFLRNEASPRYYRIRRRWSFSHALAFQEDAALRKRISVPSGE